MNEEIKKIVFIEIIKIVFDNKFSFLNTKNCIKFYHFLLDRISIRVEELFDEENEIDFYVFDSVVYLLETFDKMSDVEIKYILQSENNMFDCIEDYSTIIKRNEIKKSIKRLREESMEIVSDFINVF